MLNRAVKKIKRKIISWLFKELSIYNSPAAAKVESYYNASATIASSAKLTDTARINNYKNDKERIQIGEHCLIQGEIFIFAHGGKVEMGNYVFVGEGSRIWSALSVKIGNNVLISHNVNIHDTNSHPLDSKSRKVQSELQLTTGLPANNFGTREAEIVIEDDVWIGFNASIHKGVTIGRGSIIAAGSYVFNDVPQYSLVKGNPGKVVAQTQ